MELNIVIDLSDIYTEDEKDVKQAIKDEIYYQVSSEVKKTVKIDIEKIVSDAKKIVVKELAELNIQELVKECVDNSDIKYGHREQLPIKEYIAYEFKENSHFRDPKRIIEDKVGKYAKELRDRYDLVFAAQVVNKLSEQGLLNDDELKKLIQ